eukprot:2435409-Pyramimonas_sp.AAC.1
MPRPTFDATSGPTLDREMSRATLDHKMSRPALVQSQAAYIVPSAQSQAALCLAEGKGHGG